jgi:virulence activator alpha
MREEGLLKLFFADALPRQEAAEILRAMRAHRLAVRDQLRALEPMAAKKVDPFPLIVLRGGIEFTEWFADWCERMEAQVLDSAPEKRSS